MAASGDGAVLSPESDTGYFSSYDDVNIHKLMLKDTSRVLAYKRFMEDNRSLFADKIVVDVGAGTGILSLFAASCGARHVYAVEAAANIGEVCQEVISANGFIDKITMLSGRVEDVRLPDGEMADVIISEWMGFYLLHESMLQAVISARDRFLRPNGAIFPSAATLYACPVSAKDFCRDNFDFWKDVYGYDFSPVGQMARQCSLLQPEIMCIPPESLLAEPQEVLSIDLKYVGVDDVRSILSSLEFVISRNDVMHGIGLWFDVTFDGVTQLVLDTSPSAPQTHWKQTVVLLPNGLLVNKQSQLPCRVMLQQVNNGRRYNITIEIPEDDDDGDDNEDTDDKMLDDDNEQIHNVIMSSMNKVI